MLRMILACDALARSGAEESPACLPLLMYSARSMPFGPVTPRSRWCTQPRDDAEDSSYLIDFRYVNSCRGDKLTSYVQRRKAPPRPSKDILSLTPDAPQHQSEPHCVHSNGSTGQCLFLVHAKGVLGRVDHAATGATCARELVSGFVEGRSDERRWSATNRTFARPWSGRPCRRRPGRWTWSCRTARHC